MGSGRFLPVLELLRNGACVTNLKSTVEVKCLLKEEALKLVRPRKLEGTQSRDTHLSSLPLFSTAVISSSTAGTAGTGAGFGFSGAGTYGYRPSSVGYGMLSGGCVTGSGNCSPCGEAKTRLGSGSEFKDSPGKTSALSSPTKKTTR